MPENVEQNVHQWNKDQINLSPKLVLPGNIMKTELSIEMHKEEKEERKANRRKKLMSISRREGAKSFNLTVDVHLTLFRQNKMSKDSEREESYNKSEMSMCESSSSGGDSDDLYLPSPNTCQYSQNLTSKSHGSPVTRSGSRRALIWRVPSQKTPTSAPPNTNQSPHLSLKAITYVSFSSVVKIRKLLFDSRKE
ncbi:hypothetical protein HPG69_012155 [Diceros bicornis minor]|uniref:Uncharacterized protein n=1 Tax=Diceros bicornis minor TaxID=77932 RepID=A0A7J7EMX1_DICBM|nr:hypothetical protein HPG69_012155 [Diceros bicornis minor]